MKLGSRFLITSRDYIWRAAQGDLKLQSMPTLRESQVIINVEELTVSERAQILYNHLKLGDQPTSFKKAIKPFLPLVAELKGFLPETARRLGSTFFAKGLATNEGKIVEFVQKPQQFLLETITNLADDCRAAIAVIFLNGGTVRSPVASNDLIAAAAAFGVTEAEIRKQLQALNGSLLLLAQDDSGSYWTYKHPTVSDAFAEYLAATPEMVELYLRGARPYSILYEVVCAGCPVEGAPLTIPNSLHDLLLERIRMLEVQFLKTFASYRSNKAFALKLLEARPDLLHGLRSFYNPIKDDSDARLLITLFEQQLLSEELRAGFVAALLEGLENYADASIFQMAGVRELLIDEEYREALRIAREVVFKKLGDYVEKVREDWNSDYDPENHFDDLQKNIDDIKRAVVINDTKPLSFDPIPAFRSEVRKAVEYMEPSYTPPSSTAAPVASSTPQNAVLHTLFRDLDE